MFEGRLVLPKIPGFIISFFKSLFRITCSLLLRISNHQNVDKTNNIILKFSLELSDMKSNFTLILGYHNPALNNPAQENRGSNHQFKNISPNQYHRKCKENSVENMNFTVKV